MKADFTTLEAAQAYYMDQYDYLEPQDFLPRPPRRCACGECSTYDVQIWEPRDPSSVTDPVECRIEAFTVCADCGKRD